MPLLGRISLIGIIVALMSGVGLTNETPVSIIKGTINIVLANQNGIVLMADSVQSVCDAKGACLPLPEPAKKLFQLDSVSACVIAGFGSAHFATTAPFNIGAAGILENFGDGLKGRNISFSEKLKSLYVLFGVYLNHVRTLSDLLRYPDNPKDLVFTLITAGYDIDGRAKIGTLSIVNQTEELKKEILIGKELTIALGGQFDVAEEILRNPTQSLFSNDDAIKGYTKSVAIDGGASLSIDEMRSLAEALVRYTSKRYHTVGGARQTAIFANGKLISLQQPGFKAEPSPLPRFAVVETVSFQGGSQLLKLGNMTGLFRTALFKNTRWRLDGNLFFRSLFVRSELEYNGGITHLDPDNVIQNSTLVLLPGAERNPEAVKRLTQGFKWDAIVRRAESPQEDR